MSCPLSSLSAYPFRCKFHWKQPELEESPSESLLAPSNDQFPGCVHTFDLSVSKSYLGLPTTERAVTAIPCPSFTSQPLAEEASDNTCEVLCCPFVEGAAVQSINTVLDKITVIIWDQFVWLSLSEDISFVSFLHFSMNFGILYFCEGLIVQTTQKGKKLSSITTSSWNIAVVFLTSIIRYLCTESMQLFRLMFHIKECICKM